MAFALQAPWPGPRVTVLLPQPVFGDSVAPTGVVDMKRTMTGIKYVYITTKDLRKKLIWQFELTAGKAEELKEFFTYYASEETYITDHFGDAYIGSFTMNPFDFEGAARWAGTAGGGVKTNIQIEFEGTKQ